jgi:FkbM family methyltransferase
MKMFRDLIKTGDFVIEVGGHIGFISTFFASLVGQGGRVDVFEPGSNNLPYIRANLSPENIPSGAEINLIEAAAGDANGEAKLYEDQLTGQNNSVIKDFDGLSANSKKAYVGFEVQEHTVKLVSLDEYLDDRAVDFVKIDVEGFEISVLRGMRKIISVQRPIIMVEVQANHEEVAKLFLAAGYETFSPSGLRIVGVEGLVDNVFALHSEVHALQISRFFAKRS